MNRWRVGYQRALALVRETGTAAWEGPGTWCVDDRYITETDRTWVFTVGPREWLFDDDPAFADAASVTRRTTVDKHTGQVENVDVATLVRCGPVRGRRNPAPTVHDH